MKTVKIVIGQHLKMAKYSIPELGYECTRMMGCKVSLDSWLSNNAESFEKISDTEYMIKITAKREKLLSGSKSANKAALAKAMSQQNMAYRSNGNR